MTAEAQTHWESKLLTTSTSVFSSPVIYEPWLSIPIGYIICTLDNAIPVGLQRGFVEFLNADAPSPVTVVEIEASHSPFFSVPGKTVEAIEVMAKAGEKARAEKS